MNALLHRDRPLPIFSPLDEPTETFDKACLPTADFIYVDAGQEHNVPYSGCSWYAAEVVQYMLNIQTITLSDCKSSLTASRHISTKELAFCFETIQQCWETATYEKWGSKEQAEKNAKYVILALEGMWNSTEQHAWNKVCSTYQSDAGNNVTSRRDIGDGVFEFTCCTDIVSLFSMAPLGRIALDVEQMRVSQATREIQKHPQLKIAGAHVDCVLPEASARRELHAGQAHGDAPIPDR